MERLNGVNQMNRIALVATMLCATPLVSLPLSASVNAAEAVTAATCQPLTATNMEACCAAKEWREIVLPGDVRFCPPLNSSDTDSGRVGAALASNPGSDPATDPAIDPGTTGTIDGNPGNDKAVGGAGEKGMDTESPSTGTEGNSN